MEEKKFKIIKLSETHYIGVDDLSPIPNDFVYSYVTNTIARFTDPRHFSDGTYKKITHSTQPLECDKMWTPLNCERWLCNNIPCCGKFVNQKIKPLSLSEVEEAIYGYSVEQMAEEEYPFAENTTHETIHKIAKEAYIKGFNTYKELVKNNYTFEQVLDAWELGAKEGLPLTKKKKEELIQSLLPKTEWDAEIDENGKITLL